MYKIGLVGAGNLGRRHIEGLIKLPQEKTIWVVDPSEASLAEARRVPRALGREQMTDRMNFGTSMQSLPDRLDYVVVATSADVRLAVIQQLLDGRTIKAMLLEKVLFQRQVDYAAAATLIAQAGVQTWVNTARRAINTHQSIKKFFQDEVITYFDVRGGEWGLGCNGIHFLDFLSFLTGSSALTLSTDALDRSIIASKRPGFGEFTGTLRGRIGEADFALNAARASTAPLLVTIRSEHRSCILDESSGHAFLHARKSDPAWSELRFKLPFTSDLSTVIADAILTTGSSTLPDFSTSAALHLPFVEALAAFSARYCGGTLGFAPIT